jgi:hypothetical protein
MRRGLAAAVFVGAVVGAVVTAAACTGSGLSTEPTLTEQQANEQADQRIADAARQLSPQPELVRKPNQDVACTGLSSQGPAKLTVGRVYELHGLQVDRGAEYADTLRRYWTSQGYREMEGSATYPLVRAEHPRDGFKLSFSIRNGVAELTAVLSCIWPDGTPPPTTR